MRFHDSRFCFDTRRPPGAQKRPRKDPLLLPGQSGRGDVVPGLVCRSDSGALLHTAKRTDRLYRLRRRALLVSPRALVLVAFWDGEKPPSRNMAVERFLRTQIFPLIDRWLGHEATREAQADAESGDANNRGVADQQPAVGQELPFYAEACQGTMVARK